MDLNQYLRILTYEEHMMEKQLKEVTKEVLQYDARNSSIVIKKIRGHLYYYEQWREEGRIRSRSLGAVMPGSIAEIEQSMMKKQKLKDEKYMLELMLNQLRIAKEDTQAQIEKQSILTDYLFEVYWKDMITARVYVHKNDVTISRFVEHPVKQIFAKNKMTRHQLNQILESRCWDKNRPDLSDILHRIGLTEYNPQEIVRKTHGVMRNDYIWFRFPGEELTCKDVLPRFR